MLAKTILVATDFSPIAQKATEYALELAHKLEAKVHLVHVWVLPIISYPDVTLPLPRNVIEHIAKQADENMQAVLAKCKTAGVSVSGSVICGDPREQVLERAVELHADLLVVGTHGRTGLRRALLGSVSEHLMRHAGIPVLVCSGHQDSVAVARELKPREA